MATIGQVYYNVIDQRTRSCSSNGPGIFKEGTEKELVGRCGANSFTKLGVQAKPGTRMVLNNNKTIMIGQTGTYEIEDVTITSLYFERPLKYSLDIDASDSAISNGLAKIKEAEAELEEKVKVQTTDGITTISVKVNDTWMQEPDKSDEDNFKFFWNTYSAAQGAFIEKYNEGLNLFQTGENGIYKLPNPDNLKAPENYDDLYDVIVDFIYE